MEVMLCQELRGGRLYTREKFKKIVNMKAGFRMEATEKLYTL
jgi:hypothetical protein